MPDVSAGTCIIPWDEARKRAHERGFSMPYVGRQTGAQEIALHMSVVDPGERAHPPHAHADEEILFLLEGTAEATIGEEMRVIRANTAVFCPPNVTHGLRNCGATPMRYLVIRRP
jgi:mannose-6-phosphate isomerase-like protein (cupin superfamily)